MSDKPPTLPPASEPFPGSRTPGWNDPPTLQYSPLAACGTNAASGRTPRLLNKRVAFPLQSTDTNMNAATKPTAIVPPHQVSLGGSGLPPPMSLPPSAAAVAGSIHPIAVVHPMPNANAPPQPPPLSSVTPIFVPTQFPALSVESGAAITATTITAAPRIFVPPHQEDTQSRPAATVQHI